MQLRTFPADVELLAKEWRARAESGRAWKPTGDAPIGESDPFYVTSGDLSGVAKPRETKPPPSQFPRAAYEKIASDLAYDLGLPVPPVTLWTASSKLGLPIENLAVSLFPFSGPISAWNVVEDVPVEAERLAGMLTEVSSAMVAFDLWVGNCDRKNSGNLIFHERPADGVLDVAYIDFAHSLLAGWDRPIPPNAYPTAGDLKVQPLKEAIAAIEKLGQGAITEVVTAIPDEFLEESKRRQILTRLLKGQLDLRARLMATFGELAWE